MSYPSPNLADHPSLLAHLHGKSGLWSTFVVAASVAFIFWGSRFSSSLLLFVVKAAVNVF